MDHKLWVILTLCCAVFSQTGVEAREVLTFGEDWRTWTSNDGKEIKAKMISVDADWVTLERDDGRTFILDIERLSPSDKKHIERVVDRIIFDHGLPDEVREEVLPKSGNLIRNGDFFLEKRYWNGDFEILDGFLRLIPSEEIRYTFQDLRSKKLNEYTRYKIRFRYRCSPEFLRWNARNMTPPARSIVHVHLGYGDEDGRIRIGTGIPVPRKVSVDPGQDAKISKWQEFSSVIGVKESNEYNSRYDIMLSFRCNPGKGFVDIDDVVLTEVVD